MKKGSYLFLFLLLGLLLLQRFLHLGETLENPHLWRQSDTAFYIYDFFKNGINLLRPSVCWMGGYKTLLLEFPLHEAIAAKFCQIFGYAHIWARLLTLAGTALSAFYLFNLLSLFRSKSFATKVVLIYLTLPISLFYSRAVHIDFFVMGFVHAGLFYLTKGIIAQKIRSFALGIVLASVAALIKIPYLFASSFFLLPLLWERRTEYKILAWQGAWLIPLLVFWAWYSYTRKVHQSAPDWDILPGYHKFLDMGHWYYGSWAQRMQAQNYYVLAKRLVLDVGGGVFALFACWGVFALRKNAYLAAATLGGVCYVFIFFNLNLIHDYYQIPLLPLIAIFAGMGIEKFSALLGEGRKYATAFSLLLGISTAIFYAEKNYYQPDFQLEALGKTIAAQSQASDFLMISHEGQDLHCPLLLYPAKRLGWSIHSYFLNTQTVANLSAIGANLLFTTSEDRKVLDSLSLQYGKPNETQVGSYKLKRYRLGE